jgi:hypothetical protein
VGERRRPGVPEPAGLSRAAFLGEVERACAGVPGVTVQPRDGYLAVTIELASVPPGLSERTRSLISAFPEQSGVRTLHIDVRNRQWAAMVVEIAHALREPTAHKPVTPRSRGNGV